MDRDGNPHGSGSAGARRSGGARGWIAVGAWIGVLLAGGRAAVLWAMEAGSHANDPAFVRVRLAAAIAGIVVLAFAVAWIGSGVLRLLARSLARGERRPAVLVGILLAIAYANVLLGWWGADPSRRVGTDTSAGLLAVGVVCASALALAAFHVALGGRTARGAGLPAWLTTPWPPILLAFLAPLALRRAYTGVDERMLLRSVERELFAQGGWKVVEAYAEKPAYAGLLCPSVESGRDGADMQGLVMPPPARVRLALGESRGPRWLTGRAGIDHLVREQHDELAGASVRFTVELNGRAVYEHAVGIEEGAWADVGDGIVVPPGSVLELATSLVGADGRELEPPAALAAGFGGLALEERHYRERTRSSADAPNVVLIVMDTQRADRMSVYGYDRDTTPELARLAARGVVFDAAYSSASWTWPSTASILTGLHPEEHGVQDAHSCFLPYSVETLPEALQRAGFSTAGWSANPLIVADKNFDQGFELFDATSEGGMRRSDVLVPEALDWLDAISEWRFFLYLHLVDPHAPLSPLPEAREALAGDVPASFDPRAITDYGWQLLGGAGHTYDGEVATERVVPPEEQRWIGELYDACVRSGDHWIGRVLERLAELGLDEKTVVVVTADHGEELFDHGLATHGQSVHRELVNVPLVIAGPGIPRGERVASPVSNRHLAPTIARIAGVEIRGLADAPSLLADPPAGPVVYSTTVGWWNGVYPRTIYGMREGSMVLHVAPEGAPWHGEPGTLGQWRLYDLATDPTEHHDLASEEPERAERMRAAVMALAHELEKRRRAPRIEAGGATLERLRDLGYVQD